ncbi:hypothetical protein K469DRAFT_311033 [Zopfia rhizophila CBS 207.26]|uniref:Uncharacterized protein n=1 Tax=Zopfia rhizophila CBS 207.26 TaxID=1314779 RepID=A0A6A6EML9_9PEZI|nr:hypothetical protein K469DRAFT_311033 [Zopfia rhizophila CBS 207.26]
MARVSTSSQPCGIATSQPQNSLFSVKITQVLLSARQTARMERSTTTTHPPSSDERLYLIETSKVPRSPSPFFDTSNPVNTSASVLTESDAEQYTTSGHSSRRTASRGSRSVQKPATETPNHHPVGQEGGASHLDISPSSRPDKPNLKVTLTQF